MLREEQKLSEASDKLGQVQAAQSIQAINYSTYRAPGSKWSIEHAQAGEDYIYQIFPLRPPKLTWQGVIYLFIAAMDTVFPRSVEIKYIPPSQKFELKYYTIRVEKVTNLPGWEDAARVRALRGLSGADAWPLEAG